MWTTTKNEPKLGQLSCNVFGCYVNLKWQPKTVFFSVPQNPVTRKEWLDAINRNDLIGRSSTLCVCDRHFEPSDLIITPQGKKLSAGARPKLHLPTPKNPLEKAVQVCPQFEKTWVQTNTHFKSDMVVQAGPSFTSRERHKQKLSAELEKYQNHLKMIESDDLNYQMDLFYKSCDKFLSPQLSELIKAQTKSMINNEDYSHNILPCLKFCLNLYHASPKAYRSLKNDLQLPSIATLKGMHIPIPTEVNDDTMAPLKLKVSNMAEAEKYCSVSLDVMPLKSLLSYNSKEDKIVGFHEIDGVQAMKPAQRALVVVVRGILVDWSQPLAFSLISDNISRQDISSWVDKILIKLLDCGLKVKVFVCTSKYRKYVNEHTRLVSGSDPFFFVNNDKIYYMFDTPFLFRQLRNIFLTHDVSFQEDDWRFLARFQDIREFYELDQTRRLKCAPKLTSAHINPTPLEKTETKYATQLLSRSVAAGLSAYQRFGLIKSELPMPTRTVEFLLLMNDMFDLLNASTNKAAYRGAFNQVNVLEKAIKLLESLKIMHSTTGLEIKKKPIFVAGLQINIKSILGLFEDLKTIVDCKKLMTRRLNLETTENLIRKLKPRGTTPVSQRFINRFRKLYLSYILQPLKLGTSSDNLGELIIQLNELSNNLGKSDLINTALVQCERDLPILTLLEMAKALDESSIYHLCGFLLKKCVCYHNNCQTLKVYADNFELKYGLVEPAEGTVKPEANSGEDFIEYVGLMDDVCRKSFDFLGLNCHIGSITYNTLNTHLAAQAPMLCPCFPVEFLQKLFIRLRLYMIVHYNNSLYRINRYKGESFSFPTL